MIIDYGILSTQYGNVLLGVYGNKIAFLGFTDNLKEMKPYYKQAEFRQNQQKIQPFWDIFLSHPSSLEVYSEGSDFQRFVWKILRKIPVGETRSYQEIAHMIGHPKAARAVGTAIGKNPISLLVPCHRVVRSNGDLGGYRWGLGLKKAFLDREKQGFCSAL